MKYEKIGEESLNKLIGKFSCEELHSSVIVNLIRVSPGRTHFEKIHIQSKAHYI